MASVSQPPPVTYPPPVQRWRFAEPPVRRRWFWVAVVGGPAAVLAMVVAFGAMVVLEVGDSPGLIDDPEVMSAVDDECRSMTSTVEGLPLAGGPGEQARRIIDQNDAVEQMVEAIRELGSDVLARDRPTQEWLADWDRLVEARATFARDLATETRATLDVPRVDGQSITDRMDEATLLIECVVPEELTEPVFADSRST